MSTPWDYCLGNEKPMNSALNSAHFYSRRAEKQLEYGRYDDAINNHKETVNFLTQAITESTIPKNIEHLKVQRDYHENIQQIIKRQKHDFEYFLLRNGLKKVIKKPDNDNEFGSTDLIVAATDSDDNEFVSLCAPDSKEDYSDDNEFFSLCAQDSKDDVSDDNEFFSLLSELEIDENGAINITHPTTYRC